MNAGKLLWVTVIFIFAAVIHDACAQGSSRLIIVDNGIANAAIYAPADIMADQTSGPSVRDLAAYLEKMSGAKIEIRTPDRMPQEFGGKIPILIGEFAAQLFGPIKKKSEYKQGWRYVVSQKGVGLYGESPEATSYAIYELLDRLGCRWYMPGEPGEVIPKVNTINLSYADISDVPRVIYRAIWYADNDFKRRNRLGGPYLSAGHALEMYLTYDAIGKQLLQQHPEWYAEINGKRAPSNRVCWANNDVAQAIADAVIRYFDTYKNAISASLSPDDGIVFCECAGCKALDAGDWFDVMNCNSMSDRFVHFANEIVDRVAKKYPDKLFGFYAYAQYTKAPVREKLRPNLVPVIAPILYCRAHSMTSDCPSRKELRKVVDGWAKAARMFGLYEYEYNLAEVSAPNPHITKQIEELSVYYSYPNFRFWQPETMANFESALPGLYLGIRMSWYNRADPNAILDEMYRNFYGPARDAMKKYWTVLDEAQTKSDEHAGCGFGYLRRFPPETLGAARKAIDDALSACKPGTNEYGRVKMAHLSLSQFELFMKMQRNFADADFSTISADADTWIARQSELGELYKNQYAFLKGTDRNWGVCYFQSFFEQPYRDGAKLSSTCDKIATILSPRYLVDANKEGERHGWFNPDFDDASWKSCRLAYDTWSDIGLWSYFGPVWYRASFQLPDNSAGKRIYLFAGSVEGTLKVYVNGKHIKFKKGDGSTADVFAGSCQSATFDITDALKTGKNTIALVGTRTDLNELGTGGLMGPIVIFREK